MFHEPGRDLPVEADADVIVCGGGPAGVTAAITAARAGAQVRRSRHTAHWVACGPRRCWVIYSISTNPASIRNSYGGSATAMPSAVKAWTA